MKDKPAFPYNEKILSWDGENSNEVNITRTGMTLRDYLAAKAMQSYLRLDELDEWSLRGLAKGSYKVADAMLKEKESTAN